MHMRINNYMNINMIRFRVGAWRINVNNLNMKQIVRSERHCDYCINNNYGKYVRMWSTLSFIVRPMVTVD